MMIWILFIGTYYLFLVYPIIRLGIVKKLFPYKDLYKGAIVLLGIYSIVGIIIYLFIKNEQYIYYWDYGIYYKYCINVKEMYMQDPLSVLINAYQTSIHNDYGTWSSAIIAWLFQFTKCRYLDYIMLLYIVFAVPVSLSLSGFVIYVCHKRSVIKYIICNCMTLVTPWFLVPMLKGYTDIAALLPAVCSLWILFGIGMNKLKVNDILMLSLSLICSVVLRRYFSFWIVGFVFASVGYSVSCWFLRKEGKKEIKKYLLGYIGVGAVSLFIILFGMNGFIQRVLFKNYADQYVAYNYGTLFEKYKEMLLHFGIVMTILFVSAFIFLIVKQKRFFPLLIFCITYEIIATLGLFRINTPGIHHYWVFWIPLQIPIEMLMIELLFYKKSLAILGLVCMIYNSFYVYSGGFFKINSIICQQDRYEVRRRNDLQQISNLHDYLENNYSDSKIYVIASGVIFNDSILQGSCLPDSCGLNLVSSHVDLRDGFCVDFFNSDVVITTNPVEIHLRDGTQQVVTILQKEFEEQPEKIATHFKKRKEFILDENVKVCVYQKISDFKVDDILYLEELYDASYAENRELFHDRFERYIVESGRYN